ncbi:hypothetical protein HOP51_18220 [Halomonas sp. MCCC 1A11036]|uniref:Porin n=1 Tax=Billgrantia zhangzhouensis TaxID=2733481 RepID=A0ABS9AK79_9GAMM|nr:TorF family putative porin [Halomonas zhangzhouensis]MCE8022028.1 hypothetical protein [Halomonas zhangzhouensis]
MNKTSAWLATGVFCAASFSAHAWEINDDFSLYLDIKALSDYRAGGVSMTSNDSALWLDATLVHSKSGGHAGIFTSNIDFGTEANREFAYYLGITRPITENLLGSFTRIEFEYPRDNQFNFGEWIATLSAYGVTLGVKYSDDMKPDAKRTIAWLEYEHSLPHETTLGFRYGLTDQSRDIYVDDDGSRRSTYYDWEIGIGKRQWGLDWRLAYIDTDLSRSECASAFGASNVCSATLVGSISKLF